MKKGSFVLLNSDAEKIASLLSKGNLSDRLVKRCQCLTLLASGKSQKEISSITGFSLTTIGSWYKKYQTNGLVFLYDEPRSGRPLVFDGEQRAKITALACETSPDGHSHWSLRILAEKVVELEISSSISHQQVKKILKKTI